MKWITSNWIIIMIIIVLSANITIIALVSICHFLYRKIRMRYLSLVLKGIILYLIFFLPISTVCFLKIFDMFNILNYKTVDFSYIKIVEHRSFSILEIDKAYLIFFILFIIWIFGALYFGLYRYYKIKQLFIKVEKVGNMIRDSNFDIIKSQIFIKHRFFTPRIALLESSLVPTPLILGLFKIRIFLPYSNFTKRELELIYEHELFHCKACDCFYRNLSFLLCSIYWFNPIVYYLSRYFIDINEMACDERVLKNKAKSDRLIYAKLIYRIAENNNEAFKIAATFTTNNSQTLERRIKNMKRTPKKMETAIFAVLVMVTALLCPVSALAASAGITKIQDSVVEKIDVLSSTKEKTAEQNAIEYRKKTNARRLSEYELQLSVEPKGSNPIDLALGEGQIAITSSVYLSEGSKVHIYLLSNSNVYFDSGLIDEDGYFRYVSSQDGEINHTFTINTSGYYDVYIENTCSEDINVSGNIYISD